MTVDDVVRRLPDILTLLRLCQSMAMLEAILSPDAERRNHFFVARWLPDVALASMSNGSGDEYSVVFSPAGVFVRGFDHESPMSPYVNDEPWPGVLDSVLEEFRQWVKTQSLLTKMGCWWRLVACGVTREIASGKQGK